MTAAQNANPPQIRLRQAKKEIGFGMPPSFFGATAAEALSRILAAPTSRGIIVESASWTVDVPITDAQVGATFGKTINILGTPNAQPPTGVASAQNTLVTAGMPSSDMIILGIRPRFLVEPESRLIRGNTYNPTGLQTPVGSPDVFSNNDFANNAFGFPTEGPTPTSSGYLPSEFLWGTPTWRIAYAAMKAYNLQWAIDNQDNLINEPLTEIGTVQPFAEAQAAGTSFTSNIDRIAVLNARMATLVVPPLFFSPISHKRLGSFNAGGQTNTGDFTVTREEDGSPTVFGGIGTPQDPNEKSPLVFAVPVYWPSGQPLGITYELKDTRSQAEMQRWLSVTGGVNGVAGQDLNLPPGVLGGFTAGMAEVTLDPVNGAGVPTSVPEGTNLNRCLEKGGVIVMQLGLIGMRITQPWKAAVMQAINAGAIQAPVGFGSLPSAT